MQKLEKKRNAFAATAKKVLESLKRGAAGKKWTEFRLSLFADLATYDTAKHKILKHTDFKDNYVTHGMARYNLTFSAFRLRSI